MTDEIIKLYENAGINQVCNTCELRGFKRLCPTEALCVRTNPPFTAEKQIELIKWTARREPKVEIGYSSVYGYWVENQTDTRYYFGDQFDNALASLINSLWQELSEEDKQQVKGILGDKSN